MTTIGLAAAMWSAETRSLRLPYSSGFLSLFKTRNTLSIVRDHETGGTILLTISTRVVSLDKAIDKVIRLA